MGIRQKITLAVVAVVCVALWPIEVFAVTTQQSVAIPAYSYPEGGGVNHYWHSVLSAGGGNVPLLIANVNSGPDQAVKADYRVTLDKAKARGSRVVGYVRTGYETRSISEVLTEVDRWYALYGHRTIDGIFFDEISNMYASSPDKLCYLSTVYNYVKAKYGGIVFANPGSQVSDAMSPYADVFVAAEYDVSKYKYQYKPPVSQFETNPINHSRIMHMVYGVSSSELQSVIQLSRQRNAGYVFITDDGGDNPYDALPSYFAHFTNSVKALPATKQPHEPTKRYPAGCMDIAAHSQPTEQRPGLTRVQLSATNQPTSRYHTTLPLVVKFHLPAGASLGEPVGRGWHCRGDSCFHPGLVAKGGHTAPLSVMVRSTTGGTVAYTVQTADQTMSGGTVAVAAVDQSARHPQPQQPDAAVPKPPRNRVSDLADGGVSIFWWLAGGGMVLLVGLWLVWLWRRRTSRDQ